MALTKREKVLAIRWLADEACVDAMLTKYGSDREKEAFAARKATLTEVLLLHFTPAEVVELKKSGELLPKFSK